MMGTFIFLGTGGSMGIPVIGCRCAVCLSEDTRNQRLRAAALLSYRGRQILIDAGPDLRQQVLRKGIAALDGVVLTHAHYDHIAGLDDLRPLFFKRSQPLPLLMSATTQVALERSFAYLLEDRRLAVELLPHARGSLIFQELPLQYFTYQQMGMAVNGFRCGDLAYVSDIRDYPNTLFADLQGVKTLIISALRTSPSNMHFTVQEAIDFIERSGAQQGLLTHIAHDLEHAKIEADLPANIRLAYDGLELPFMAL